MAMWMNNVEDYSLRKMYNNMLRDDTTGETVKAIEEVIHHCLPHPDTYYYDDNHPDGNAWKLYLFKLMTEQPDNEASG